MTGESVLLSLLIIGTLLTWCLAGLVLLLWKRVSAATHTAKAPARLESRLVELEADQVSLSSSFEKVAKDLKRLNSRAGMRELRAESSQERSSTPPPVGTSKAELLRHYGMSGKVGPEFARAQQALELNSSERKQ